MRQGFEYVDPDAQSESIYFAGLVQALLNLGYVRGQNLLGAPVSPHPVSPSLSPSFYPTSRPALLPLSPLI